MARKPPPPERGYNYIYQKIVNGPDDIVGLIAYGIYKRKKIEHIEEFRGKHGHGPCDADLQAFHEISCGHVEEYRESADQLMFQSFRAIHDSTISRMQEDCESEVKERMKGTFWRSVWSSVVGTVLTALLVGAVIVAIVGYKYGWSTAGRLILNEVEATGEHVANGK